MLKSKRWQQVNTGTDGNTELFGVNIFDYDWHDTNEKAIIDGEEITAKGADIDKVVMLAVRENIGRFKYVAEENISAEFDKIIAATNEQFENILAEEED